MISENQIRPSANVAICDESALFFLLHNDTPVRVINGSSYRDPLAYYATTLYELRSFNTKHPLFGGEPVAVIANDRKLRVSATDVKAHLITAPAPPFSFFELRTSLFLATPEFVFARMANYVTDIQLVEIGINLCGRYYIDIGTGKIVERTSYLTTPHKLATYLETAADVRGHSSALRALKWVLPNSGSPEETRTKIQYANPMRQGGFGLPFTAMNFDVSAARLRGLSEQDNYSIDLVDPDSRIGLEYDGEESHKDSSKDKRRRNELKALDWNIFPIDKTVLYNPAATERLAHHLAKAMGVRLRKPRGWESRYVKMRDELGLPV